MQYIKLFIPLLFLCAFSQAYASPKCNKFLEFVEVKEKPETYMKWCELLFEVERFKSRFNYKYGSSSWEKHIDYKINDNMTVRINTFDVNTSDVISFGTLLQTNEISNNITEIEINGGYSFKKSNNNWYLDSEYEGKVGDEFSDTSKFYLGLEKANTAINKNESPEKVMAIFHKYVTKVLLKS